MNTSKLKSILIRHEGLKLFPYVCTAGKLTIGIGRNLESRGISYKEADFMLNNDIQEALTELEGIFPDFDTYSENQQIALVDMVFNLGVTGFLGFKGMIKEIQVRNWEGASKEALDSLGAKQVGVRANEISWMLKEG